MKKGYKFLMINVVTTFCKFMKIVLTNHIFKIFYFYPKVPNSAKSLTTKYWIDALEIYIARVIFLGREDAAKQLKN